MQDYMQLELLACYLQLWLKLKDLHLIICKLFTLHQGTFCERLTLLEFWASVTRPLCTSPVAVEESAVLRDKL